MKKAKDSGFRGVGCFFGGVVLVVFFKRPLLGMCLEGFGFVNLFANFFPIALSAMRSMPVLGDGHDARCFCHCGDKRGRAAAGARSWAWRLGPCSAEFAVGQAGDARYALSVRVFELREKVGAP